MDERTSGAGEYLTPAQAARLLQVRRGFVYKALNSGRLRGGHVGGHWRIRRDDVDRYLFAEAEGEAVPAGVK
jgi:excisionase family DNA binding protein